MAYQALYRKWRPQKFSEIVGQQHVTRTLQNALASGRISHAYLFCGTRGTGKTSTAKVLAKALNCTGDCTEKPCNQCDNCVSIVEGRSMDVIEIDAASNRGIDEIRDLREKINFSPSNCRFRVYIIDEVHMLTNEAFNALLKTLEEPPAHVIFVLATTEPHKVPVTILSRCQRFDFRPIAVPEIVGRMQEVVRGANLKIKEDALHIIARAADGSLRDALSILDQVASLGEGEITAEEIHRVLGTVSEDVLRGITAHLLEDNAAGALQVIDTLAVEGKDLRVFARQLGSHLRRLLVDDVSSNGKGDEEALRKRRLLLYITKLLVRYEQDMRWSSQPRLLLELFVFESIEGEGTGSADDLALRVTRLEERMEKITEKITGSRGSVQESSVQCGFKDIFKEDVDKTVTGSLQAENLNEQEQHQEGNNNGKIGNNIVVEGQRSSLSKKFSNVPVASPKTAPIPLDRVKKLWPQVLDAVKKESKAARAYLDTSWPVAVSGYTLVLGYEDGDIARDMMEKDSNQKILARVLKSFFKGEWTIRCESGLSRPEELEESTREMDFSSAAEFFSAEEVDKAPPE